MKRKVIQIANSTQLVSLPRKWALQHNIKKGDEIDVDEQGSKIVLSTNRELEFKPAVLNPPHLANVTERTITSLYRSGCKEVKVSYNSQDNPELLEFLNKKIDDQTIGFEIVKQEKNYFLIKDLSGSSEKEFDTALRRTFVLLIAMVKDSLNGLRKKDVNILKNMYFIDRSINKFTNFCARELLSKGQKDLKQTAMHYHFLRDLEALSDQFSLLSVHCSSNTHSLPIPSITVYEEMGKVVEDFYHVFYEYSREKVNDLFIKLKKIEPKEQFKVKGADPIFVYYLVTIHRRLKELIDSLIDINI